MSVDSVNGTETPRQVTLGEAKQELTDAVLDSVRDARGALVINPAEVLVNQHVDQARISALAELLVQKGILTPEELCGMAGAKMLTEAQRLRDERSRVLAVRGAFPKA